MARSYAQGGLSYDRIASGHPSNYEERMQAAQAIQEAGEWGVPTSPAEAGAMMFLGPLGKIPKLTGLGAMLGGYSSEPEAANIGGLTKGLRGILSRILERDLDPELIRRTGETFQRQARDPRNSFPKSAVDVEEFKIPHQFDDPLLNTRVFDLTDTRTNARAPLSISSGESLLKYPDGYAKEVMEVLDPQGLYYHINAGLLPEGTGAGGRIYNEAFRRFPEMTNLSKELTQRNIPRKSFYSADALAKGYGPSIPDPVQIPTHSLREFMSMDPVDQVGLLNLSGARRSAQDVIRSIPEDYISETFMVNPMMRKAGMGQGMAHRIMAIDELMKGNAPLDPLFRDQFYCKGGLARVKNSKCCGS